MTSITKFKCVACSRSLREDEYYVAYEELRRAANHIAKQILEEHLVELEIDCVQETAEERLT